MRKVPVEWKTEKEKNDFVRLNVLSIIIGVVPSTTIYLIQTHLQRNSLALHIERKKKKQQKNRETETTEEEKQKQ